jgi:hypothetical protein
VGNTDLWSEKAWSLSKRPFCGFRFTHARQLANFIRLCAALSGISKAPVACSRAFLNTVPFFKMTETT